MRKGNCARSDGRREPHREWLTYCGGKFFDFFFRNRRSSWCWYLVTMHGKSDFFSLSGRYMPKLLKIVFTFKFHPLHAKISTQTGTPVPDEKVKELSSIIAFWQEFQILPTLHRTCTLYMSARIESCCSPRSYFLFASVNFFHRKAT